MHDNVLQILKGQEIIPFSKNKPKQLVIFLHGYGSNGADLISLAREFSQTLPDAQFISTNAPFTCEESVFGFQWFSLKYRDEDYLFSGLEKASILLNEFIDQQLERFSFTEDNLILIGFSQGTMMALHVGPRRNKACKIIGYSGILIKGQKLLTEAKSKPKILMIHGKLDYVLEHKYFESSILALKNLSFPVDAYSYNDLGHTIDYRGIAVAQDFLKANFTA
ncbi:MAG: alpha/beta hydrolase [Alphaproteobacteria bacterium]